LFYDNIKTLIIRINRLSNGCWWWMEENWNNGMVEECVDERRMLDCLNAWLIGGLKGCGASLVLGS